MYCSQRIRQKLVELGWELDSSPIVLESIHTWLRDAHNLYITVDTCDNYGHWEWRIMSIILTEEGPNIDWEVNAQWDTYELALQNAIVNALSIIK